MTAPTTSYTIKFVVDGPYQVWCHETWSNQDRLVGQFATWQEAKDNVDWHESFIVPDNVDYVGD